MEEVTKKYKKTVNLNTSLEEFTDWIRTTLKYRQEQEISAINSGKLLKIVIVNFLFSSLEDMSVRGVMINFGGLNPETRKYELVDTVHTTFNIFNNSLHLWMVYDSILVEDFITRFCIYAIYCFPFPQISPSSPSTPSFHDIGQPEIEPEIEPENVLPQSKRKTGRPHHPEDEWAWDQVYIHHRDTLEVKNAWRKLDNVKSRNLADSERQFKRITRPNWGTKP